MKKAGTLSICMFAAMLFFAAGAAEAANWQRISEYEDRIIYIDNDSIRHISQTITGARFKIELKEPSWVNLKSIDHYLIEQENNCGNKKYKVYQVNVYYDDGTNDIFKGKDEYDVKPDTFQYVIHQFMCKKTKQLVQ
jgi:hypothetical protein